jgi:phage terminase large subunit
MLFPNGSRIVLGGFRSEKDVGKYVGIEYDVLGLEEATLLTWDKYRKLRGSIRSSKPEWRERCYLTTNPGGVGHAWFKKRFITPRRQGEPGGDCRFIFSTYRDNAFLSKSYTEYLEGLTGWLGRAWRDGDWDISAGQFFTTWDHDTHVIEPFKLPRNWRYWLALDYGFTHYTVAHLFGQSNDGEVFVIDEHAERRWLVKRHAQAIKDMLRRHGLNVGRIRTIVAGADVFASRGTTDATIADQYAAEGLSIDKAQMDRIAGAANILDYLGDPRAGVQPRVWIVNRCARLIETLPMMEHDPHRPEDVLKVDVDDDGNGGDDAYDAFRYGLMEAPHGKKAGTLKYA